MSRSGTLTQSVAQRLRREINTGKWSSDQPLPSERALAEKFAMSRVTARRCLRMLCREGIIVARSGRGYFPVHAAGDPETLRHRRSVIYYYASGTGSPELDAMHASIINGANAESIRLGLNLFAVSRSPVDFSQAVGSTWQDDLRGVLLDWATLKLAEQLRQRGVPFVVVEDDIEGLAVTSVIQDNAGGTMQAMTRLAESGHCRLGIIVNNSNDTHCRQRLAAYREFLLQRDLPSSPGWIASVPEGGGRAGMAALLDGPEPPTAVYVTNRGLLAGAMEELAARGLQCPQDISLLVWGDPGVGDPHGEFPHTTYVTWSAEEMGRLAVRALEDIVRNRLSDRLVLRVATQLVECRSVAPPPTRSPGRGPRKTPNSASERRNP